MQGHHRWYWFLAPHIIVTSSDDAASRLSSICRRRGAMVTKSAKEWLGCLIHTRYRLSSNHGHICQLIFFPNFCTPCKVNVMSGDILVFAVLAWGGRGSVWITDAFQK